MPRYLVTYLQLVLFMALSTCVGAFAIISLMHGLIFFPMLGLCVSAVFAYRMMDLLARYNTLNLIVSISLAVSFTILTFVMAQLQCYGVMALNMLFVAWWAYRADNCIKNRRMIHA